MAEKNTKGDLIPCRNGDRWKPVIDIETGIVTNWEQGKNAEIYYEVLYDGEYLLRDENNNNVTKYKGYYVPDFLGKFGDYIFLSIDINGQIRNWNFDPNTFT